MYTWSKCIISLNEQWQTNLFSVTARGITTIYKKLGFYLIYVIKYYFFLVTFYKKNQLKVDQFPSFPH